MTRRPGHWLLVALWCLATFSGSHAQAPDGRLIDAVKRGDVAGVRALLAQRVDLAAADADGSTALHWAAHGNNLELVDLLLDAGADARTSTRYKVTPLYFAAQNGNAAVMARLLDAGADPNGTVYEGQTMLMTAALAGKADAVRLLLTRGATVDVAEPYRGQTALMWAAAEGNADAAAVLVEAGADIRKKSTGGFTPLLFAVRNAHIPVTVRLLDLGADVNDVAPDGSSALSVATVNAYFELASVLLDRGANPNLTDPRGSPLHAVAWLRKPGADGAAGVGGTPQGTPQPVGRVTALQLAKKMLEKGANPNARLSRGPLKRHHDAGSTLNLGEGTTPLIRAARTNDVASMKALLEAGADPFLTLPDRTNALMVAAGQGAGGLRGEGIRIVVPTPEGAAEAVQLLIDQGMDVDAFNNAGNTALHAAVNRGDAVVKILVSHGARLVKNKAGFTPLDLALGRGGRGGRGGAVRESTAEILRPLAARGGQPSDAPAPGRSGRPSGPPSPR